ncbi:MAG: DUF433 domain-containing protein [Phycisphaerae bacterium]|nr:DUF433 domain-containing protein [Phycisphaerae bacterium]
MTDNEPLDRITINPKVMTGKPVIRGTRLTVDFIVGLLAHGTTAEDILKEYEGLTPEDIQACLLFASKSLESTSFVPLAAESV